MRTLNIKYGNGSMQINVDEFFPASKPRIRKLLKIMRMDWETDRVAELLQLLDDRVEDVRKTIAGGNIYAPKLQQKVDEAERAVRRKKLTLDAARANKVDRETLAQIRDGLDGLTKKKKQAAAEYRDCVKGLERARREGIALLQDIEFIKKELKDGKESE